MCVLCAFVTHRGLPSRPALTALHSDFLFNHLSSQPYDELLEGQDSVITRHIVGVKKHG